MKKGQLVKAPSVSSSSTDLRLLLGVLGAPLAPVHVSALDPFPLLSIKDTPISQVNFAEENLTWGLRFESPKMGVNRISYLPKEVLCHILSFLPTKLAVRTSILSRKWRYLWASVSALDFDDTLLFDPNKGGIHGIGGVNFINFVDRVLIRTSQSPMHRFHLRCERRHSFHLNAWINFALKRKVRVLSLSMDKMKDYTLALAPFACENLVVLKLGRNFELDVSGSFSFPNLKVFHLDSIEFRGCSSTENLFSSCPVLEDLVIHECKLDNLQSLHVSAPELKYLVIDCLSYDCYDDYYYDEIDEDYADYLAGNGNAFSDYEIIVDAPKLEVLKYKDYVPNGCSFKNCHSLARAVIDIFEFGKSLDASTIGLQLLTDTRNAKSLSLSNCSMKAFSAVNTSDLLVFSNLTRLKLGCNEYCGLLLPKLLHKTPNLEVLILGKKNAKLNTRDLEKFTWEPPQHVPECLSQNHLKTIQVRGFNGQANVEKLLTYLQENGNVSIIS